MKYLRFQSFILIVAVVMLIVYMFSQAAALDAQKSLIKDQYKALEVKQDLIDLYREANILYKIEEQQQEQQQQEEPKETSVLPLQPEILPTVFNVSGYCSCEKCCGKSKDHPLYGITANGDAAQAGLTIAMDKSYPMGTKVLIEGYEDIVFEKQDHGGAIVGNKIDIYFNTHQEALNFGRQNREVWILLSEASELAQIN